MWLVFGFGYISLPLTTIFSFEHGMRVTDVKGQLHELQWSTSTARVSKLANSGNRLSITERSVTRGNSKQRHNRTMKGDGEQYYSNEYEAVSAREAFRFSVEANIRSLICTSWVSSRLRLSCHLFIFLCIHIPQRKLLLIYFEILF